MSSFKKNTEEISKCWRSSELFMKEQRKEEEQNRSVL